MVRKISFLLAALLLAALVIAPVPALANPGQPSFSERVYGDGVAWGTKGTTSLPAPNAHNVQSFDKLFVITNGVDGQLPVAEAAPGNVNYNGGRWFTHTVTWKSNPVLLTSYAQIMDYLESEQLVIAEGAPGGPGSPPDFFQCPLLPVK